MKSLKGILSVALAAVLCVALLAGCGGGTAGGGIAADKAVHVKTIEEFLDAVKPDTEIVLEKGFYNISDTIEKIYSSADFDSWTAAHDYVEIRDEFDGCEIVIKDLSNLKIRGAGDYSDTELVVEPRYASVLYFENCTNVDIAKLTLGHTDTGSCVGNVIDFDSCRKMNVDSCDLYGCGVYGIGAFAGSGDLHIDNTIIRSCEYGPFDLYSVYGDIVFTNCQLVDSNGYGSLWDEYNNANITFKSCTFGVNESYISTYYNITFEDCSFAENYEDYEDYGDYDVPELNIGALNLYKLQSNTDISSTSWRGYMYEDGGYQIYLHDFGSTATPYYGSDREYAYLEFSDDYTAALNINGEVTEWGFDVNNDGTIDMQKGDTRILGKLYTAGDLDYTWYWLSVDIGGQVVWFY